MKTTQLHSAEKLYFVLIAILFFFLVSESIGQTKMVSEMTKQKYALQNIIMGIHSENEGVRESSIYFAGKYRFIDTEDALISQLKVEEDSDLKILIGLALFRMNSEKGMKELLTLAVKDEDSRVKRMSQAIYNEYYANFTNRTAGLH